MDRSSQIQLERGEILWAEPVPSGISDQPRSTRLYPAWPGTRSHWGSPPVPLPLYQHTIRPETKNMDIDLPYKLESVADLPGHEDRAWHVAWNPEKPLLASCSADKTVRIYSYSTTPSVDNKDPKSIPSSTYTFKLLTSIPTGHAKTVRAVAWSPSGETLATASFDSNIGIWECEKGDGGDDDEGGDASGEWECISTLEGHETECKSVAYSASGTLLASCSRDKTVWIWEVHPDGEFETISVLMEHTQDVKCVAWHPTEEILASASYDDTIKLYIEDPSDDWFCFATLTGHTSTVWSLAWSPAFGPDTHRTSASYLASASEDMTVRVWKRVAEHKWECVLVLGGHERSVYSVGWGRGVPPRSTGPAREGDERDGDETEKGLYLGWLASAGSDGKVLIWELWEPSSSTTTSATTPPRHKLLASLPSAHGVHDVNAVVWCPRSGLEDLLATTGDDGHTRVWRVVPST
ncbi:WD40-repeat-containing domain protein [Flammula alnicola]|nr:WD40-repeat-containing domain protein [Flammula alnicola]